MLYPVDLGVLTQLYAGTAPEALQLNGKVLYPSLLTRLLVLTIRGIVHDSVGARRQGAQGDGRPRAGEKAVGVA